MLADIATAGGLEMERLKALLAPVPAVPWYAAGAVPAGGRAPGPEALAAAVLPWTLGRAGADGPFLASVMASVGWLTHRDGPTIAGGCLFALALQQAFVSRRISAMDSDMRVWAAIGERWGGAEPTRAVRAAIEAAARHSHDAEAARRASRAEGADPALAAALVGAVAGVRAEVAPRDAVQALEAFASLRSRDR